MKKAEGSALVSVIIPCHNQARYLADAIESARGQTYDHIEVVVVDDGSRDDTSRVAASFAGVTCIRQQNRGLAAARNRGLLASQGQLLVFLDADDRLLPAAVERGVAALARQPDCAFVYGGCVRITADGCPIDHFLPPPTTDHYEALLRRNFIVMHGACMFRREVFDRVGLYDEHLRASEDYDLYLRITRRYPAAAHGHLVTEMRRHGASMTMDSRRMLTETLRVHRRQRRWVHGRPALEAAYCEGRRFWQVWYGDRLLVDVHLWLQQGAWGRALPGLLTLLRLHPRGFRVLARGLRVSNALDFVVGPLEALERPAPAMPAPSSGRPLVLRRLHPSGTSAGAGFNLQPGGRSALAVECENASPDTVVVCAGRALETIFGGPDLLTAVMPAELFAHPGRRRVYLVR